MTREEMIESLERVMELVTQEHGATKAWMKFGAVAIRVLDSMFPNLYDMTPRQLKLWSEYQDARWEIFRFVEKYNAQD